MMGIGEGGDSPEVTASGGIVAETILQVKTVRALRAEDEFIGRYRKAVKNIRDAELAKCFKGGFAFGFSNGLIFGVYIVGFWYGTELVIEDGLSPKDMFKSVMCILFAGMGAGQAGAMMPNVKRATTSAHDIFQLIDRQPLIDATPEFNDAGVKKIVSSVDVIQFDQVEFAYPARPELNILKGVDLT